MRRERERAKFEGARQRALARLGEQWRQLQERLRREDVPEPLPPSISRTVNGYAGTGRVVIVGPGGVTTDLGIKGISFALGHRPVPTLDEADRRERELDLAAARAAMMGPPLPCDGKCTCRYEVKEMRSTSGEWLHVAGPVVMCDGCRALQELLP
ncbi:hypothetical protein HXXDennis_10 [Xanthomonas phage HXX_Dennis]|nr:hypothetical protein CPT_Suso_010 [Stenotrophomonas phage Suso]UTQ79917.1 hypothetical protein HXXDennis_10 [Xanthomonas phage HXX_Dennis]